ncbi:hypothetical protein [Streptomyces sp. NPDC093111]|uniref:hypothetical protein n=1 Tax=Streptomyces sp. NPDC093111 TaxID=3154978 RepID=UPI0034351007
MTAEHPSGTVVRPEPRAVALSLVRVNALDHAASSSPAHGPAEPNWEMHRRLTRVLERWQADGTLREDALLLTEWLAVDLVAGLSEQFRDPARMERWLLDFGDQVSQGQQHAHPAGPTAIEILSVVAEEATARPSGTAGEERLARIGAPFLLYLRDGHELQDAREVVLTFALWAGSQLAGLMRNDAGRITAYLDARDNAR